MRKQSSVVVVQARQSVATVKRNAPEETDREEAYSYLGLVSPPNPLEKDKSSLRKISISHGPRNKIPDGRHSITAKHKKSSQPGKIIPGSQLEQTSTDSFKSKPPAPKNVEVVDSLTGYSAMLESTNRARSLVESILKEDLRWAGVPEQNYHTYSEGDFKLKLETSKIEGILSDVRSMAFAPDLIEDDPEREKVASLDTKDEILRDAISLRAKDKQKMCIAYEKFRNFRKRQDFEFGEKLRKIKDEKGHERLEARAQERALQVARLQRIVTQKKQFLSIVEQFGSQSSEQIRAVLELNAQVEVEALVKTLEQLQSEITSCLDDRQKLADRMLLLRQDLVQELPGVDKLDREHITELKKKEKDLRDLIDGVEQETTKFNLTNSKTREMILVMDMKSSSKEEAISLAQENSGEAQDIRYFKKMINETKQKREEDSIRLEELELALRETMEANKDPPPRLSSQSKVGNGGVGDDTGSPLRPGSVPEAGQMGPSPNLGLLKHCDAGAGAEGGDRYKQTGEGTKGVKEAVGVSEYTTAFQQVMEASLRVSTHVKLLPSEFDEMPSIHENEQLQPGGVNVMDALRQAQIDSKVSALDSLNVTRSAIQSKVGSGDGTPDESTEDEAEEDLDMTDYGLEAAFEQLQTIYNTINLEESKEEEEQVTGRGAQRRKVELGVLLNAGGDLLAALGVDEHGNLLDKKKKKVSGFSSSDDSDNDSNDSDGSSRSYLKGVDRYRTRKQLQNAIVRRRAKLKSLQIVTKKLNKKLSKINKKLAEVKAKRANSYTRVIKAMEGDPRSERPRVFFQSDVEMNVLREQNLKLMAEDKKWKRRLTKLLESPQDGIMAAKKKLSTVSNSMSDDGIPLRVDLRPSVLSGHSQSRKSSHSSSDNVPHVLRSSEGVKPLSGYHSEMARGDTTLSRQDDRAASPRDTTESMTEAMSTVLSSYQKEIKKYEVHIPEIQPGMADMVVVNVPSSKHFDLPPETPPPNVSVPPPAIIAQSQPPVAVAVTPFSFDASTAFLNPPEPTKCGDSSYSQALRDLANLALDGRVSPESLKERLAASRNQHYLQKRQRLPPGHDQSSTRGRSLAMRAAASGESDLPSFDESFKIIQDFIAITNIKKADNTPRARSSSPFRFQQRTSPGGMGVQGRTAAREDRKVELKVSLPSSNPTSRWSSRGDVARSSGETSSRVLCDRVVAEISLKLPDDYKQTGNAGMLEDDEGTDDGGIKHAAKSMSLYEYISDNSDPRGVRPAAPSDSLSGSLQYSQEDPELAQITAATSSQHSIRSDHACDAASPGSDIYVSPPRLNPPRVGKGPYASPALHDLYHEVEESMEEAPLASHDFLSHKLEAAHYPPSQYPSHSAVVAGNRRSTVLEDEESVELDDSDDEAPAPSHRHVGVYMRGCEEEEEGADVFDIETGLAALGGNDRPVIIRSFSAARRPGAVEDAAVGADGTLTKSVLTRQLMGRSTWDRVVGMQSSVAKDFITTQLKDSRIVFIINTAGSERRSRSPTPSTPAAARATEIGALFEDLDDTSALPDDDLVKFKDSSDDAQVIRHAVATEDASEAYDFFPVAATPPLNAPRPQLPGGIMRPPRSPKPSFTRRPHGAVS